ncbi:MAG: NACHT domain-containing protein [Cyanobacteria bacterium P01_H01_bin.121]
MPGLETLLLQATPWLTKLAVDTAKKAAENSASQRLGQILTTDVKDIPKLVKELPQRFESPVRRYVQKYQERHGQLKVVCAGMHAPISLEEVYTSVRLLERSQLSFFESTDTLQDLFRQSGKRGFGLQDAEKRPGMKVSNQQQYLMVLGGPGIGKSTFLRRVGLEALKGKKDGDYRHECIPVFLELKYFDSAGITIEQRITKEFERCGWPHAEAFAEAALDQGKLLILLDGLDEVPEASLKHVINEIRRLVDRYSQNRFIASCRIAAYQGGFPRFRDVAMASFDEEQIEQFIRNWFRQEEEVQANAADRCWELLQQPAYAATQELAQTPLLLTLLCVTYRQNQDFPRNRSKLYGEALRVLMKEWAAEKFLERDPIYQDLSPELERELLATIAYESFAADQLFFSQREVTDQIREFLVTNLNAPKHLDAEKMLNAIEVQQGLLVERARDTYSFSHLTLQEYLTAQYIVDNRQETELVENYLFDERWREVFLLVAGLIPGRKGAGELLQKMEKQVSVSANKLPTGCRVLLNWASYIMNTPNSPYTLPARRSLGVYLANAIIVARVSAITRVNAITNVITNANPRVQNSPSAILRAVDNVVSTNSIANDINSASNRAMGIVSDIASTIDIASASTIANVIDIASSSATASIRAIVSARAIARDRAIALAKARATASARSSAISIGISSAIAGTNKLQEDQCLLAQNSIKLVSNLRIAKTTLPGNKISAKEWLSFAIRLSDLIGQALELPLDTQTLSEESANSWAKYLYGVELIVRCKDATVRVSPQVWQEIEDKLLTVPDHDKIHRASSQFWVNIRG